MPVRSQEKAYHDERSYSNRGATYPNSARPAGIPAASAWISPWYHSHPLRGSNARGVRRTHRGRLGESSPQRNGYRNGYYQRDLVTTTGRITDLKVPRDREGQFHTQVFDRYRRYEPQVAEGLTQMFVSGTSTRHPSGE